jgi:hypothetical protein
MSRVRPSDGPTISLFPFLAVLLCTMGALLVLLVLFSRSAQHGGAAEAEADIAELELAKENLAWRLEQLKGVRDRTADDLAKARLQLAGTEEHTRELTDELERLEKLHAELAAGAGSKQADADLAALEAKLKSARESLDKTRAEMATKPAAYAVVPYVGSNGTHRRPLYIECCIDGVFLQPEGIRLNPSDFEGPPGPGNPLASALRAAREHIAKTTPSNGDPAAQPYPLLLVRPSGVMAYYVAREAIQSWGSDFGYQLVDEDWTLQFPPRDPTLAEVEKRAIEESRRRLEWLAQVRPARPARPVQQYRAATTRGGVVEEGGPSVLGDTSRFNWTSQQAEAGAGNGTGGFGGGAPAGTGTAAGGVPVGRGRPLAAGGEAGDEGGDGQAAGDVILGGGGNGSLAAGGSGAGGAGMAGRAGGADGPPGSGAGPGGPAAAGGDRQAGGERNAGGDRYAGASRFAGGRGAAAGDAAGGTATEGAASGGAAAGGTAAAASSGNGSAADGSATASAAGGGGQGMSGGPAMPGLMQSGGAAGASGASGASASASMAQARGKNWASLATQDRPIPLTRPIRLECALDEFRLLDDAGRRVQVKIPVGGDTAEAIDPLVQAIHKRVAGWGIAGERMYWKPQLVLSATPDGQSRRDDLERLLADSGIDTRSDRPDDEIRDLPPVRRTSYTTSPR